MTITLNAGAKPLGCLEHTMAVRGPRQFHVQQYHKGIAQ
jgi:hypothetical protein